MTYTKPLSNTVPTQGHHNASSNSVAERICRAGAHAITGMHSAKALRNAGIPEEASFGMMMCLCVEWHNRSIPAAVAAGIPEVKSIVLLDMPPGQLVWQPRPLLALYMYTFGLLSGLADSRTDASVSFRTI